jgi:hypothetical protein
MAEVVDFAIFRVGKAVPALRARIWMGRRNRNQFAQYPHFRGCHRVTSLPAINTRGLAGAAMKYASSR